MNDGRRCAIPHSRMKRAMEVPYVTTYAPPLFNRASAMSAQMGVWGKKECGPIDVEKMEAAIAWTITQLPIVRSKILSAVEAVVGTEDVMCMKMSTAAGWPLEGTKGEWWTTSGIQDVSAYIDDLNAGCGKREMPLNLKDELRPARKGGVPRAFVCVPPEVIVVGRMLNAYYDDCIAKLDGCPIAVGANVWEGGFCKLMSRFDREGQFLCGDYKAWDTSLHPYFASVLTKVRQATMLLSQGEAELLGNYYYSVFNSPVVDVTGGKHARSGGMPSGMSSTAVDNSILNMVVMRYILGDRMGASLFYGDDHVVEISGELPDMITEMKTLGLTYTDVGKSTNVHLVDFEGIEFLKLKPKTSGLHVMPMRLDTERVMAILEYFTTKDPQERQNRAFAVMLLSYHSPQREGAWAEVEAYLDYHTDMASELMARWKPVLERLAIAGPEHHCSQHPKRNL